MSPILSVKSYFIVLHRIPEELRNWNNFVEIKHPNVQLPFLAFAWLGCWLAGGLLAVGTVKDASPERLIKSRKLDFNYRESWLAKWLAGCLPCLTLI